MSRWILALNKKPGKKQLCDFVAPRSKEDPQLWMLCSARYQDTMDFDWCDDELYWRPAAKLPRKITNMRPARGIVALAARKRSQPGGEHG